MDTRPLPASPGRFVDPLPSIGLVALLALLLPGCFERSTVVPAPVPVERLTPSGSGFYTGLRESLRVVVRDPAEFEKLWKMAWTFEPAPPLPQVDFGTHMVLVVAMGERSSGGYAIQVTDALRDGAGLEAHVRSTVPGAGCAVSAAMTQPADFVSVPVRAALVQFKEARQVTDCR
jgi:hypothetical protein